MTLLSVHQQWFHMVLSKITISKAPPSEWTSRLTKTLLISHPHTLIVSQISLLTILGELSSWWLFNPPRSLQNSFTPHSSPLALSFFGIWDFLPIVFFTQSKHSLSQWQRWGPDISIVTIKCCFHHHPWGMEPRRQRDGFIVCLHVISITSLHHLSSILLLHHIHTHPHLHPHTPSFSSSTLILILVLKQVLTY